MTIYQDSKRIVKKAELSADTTGTQVTASNGVVSFDITTRATNHAVTYDIGSNLSDSAWVMRAKLDYVAITGGSGSTAYLELGVGSASSSTAFANGGITQDFIGLQQRKASDADGWGLVGYNSTGGLDNPESPLMDAVPNTSTTYYVEIKRLTSTSMSIGLYTTSSYQNLISGIALETKTDVPSGVTGLRYIRVGNAGMISETAGNVIEGTVTDVEIWDGVTTASGDSTYQVHDPKPTNVQAGSRYEETDTRKMYHYEEQVPDYDYPMTTDPRTNTFERNATYGSITYDSTNDELLMAVDSGSGESTGSMTYIDLGSTLSSEFVLRFENSPTGTPSYATNAHNVVGISSVAPTTYGAISSTDWVGIRWYFGTQWNTANKEGIEPRIGENTSSNNHNNSTAVDRLYGKPNAGSNANGRFFHELVWNNGTLTYKVYDNANYTGTVLATAILSSSSNTQWVTGTPSNVTGLRYIVFNNGSDHYYGTYNQILDNIQIWDGVTVPTTGNAWKELGT